MFDMTKAKHTDILNSRSGQKFRLQEDHFRSGYYFLQDIKSDFTHSVDENGFVEPGRESQYDIVSMAYVKRNKKKRLY